jgi:hypothetical protein
VGERLRLAAIGGLLFMTLRKSTSTLTPRERAAFVAAVKQLKTAPSKFTPPTRSRYDDYVYIHMQAMLVIKVNDPSKPVDNANWTDVSSMRMPMWAHRYITSSRC